MGKHAEETRKHSLIEDYDAVEDIQEKSYFDQDFLIKSNYLFIIFSFLLFCLAFVVQPCYNYSNRVVKEESWKL